MRKVLPHTIRSATLLLAFILSSVVFSQSTTIGGKVVDTQTKFPIPFATISILGTHRGSVANEEGSFDLIATTNDSISFSCLGYAPLSLSIQAIQTSGKKIFELKKESIVLDEVIVTGERTQLSGEEILKQALKNQKKNFPSDDYTLSVFFRETNNIDDEYFKLVEAAAKIQGKRYPITSKKVIIEEIRSASQLDLSIPVNTEMNNYNPFREFQGMIGKVSNVRACKNCKYQIEDYVNQGDGMAAIIVSKGANEAYPRVFRQYIDLETFAIIRMEFETHIPFGQGFPQTHEYYESSLVYLKRTFDYKVYNGKYYLNRYYQKGTHQYNAMGETSESYQSTHEFHVITNDIVVGDNTNLNDTNEMSYKDQIIESSKTYNPDFWRNYNLLKQTPLDQKIILDIKKKKSSKHIFSNNK